MISVDGIASIFIAIWFWDKNPVNRLEIIHATDAINFLEPSETEIDVAIEFLRRHHLVSTSGDLVTITDAGREMVDSAAKGATNIFETSSSLRAKIVSLGAV